MRLAAELKSTALPVHLPAPYTWQGQTMTDLKTRFGRLVAAHRRARKLSQQQLADLVDISVDMIARIETGRSGTRFDNIEAIAKALTVDPAELFTADLPKGALERRAMTDVSARLHGLSDQDLAWIDGVLDAVLKPRRDRAASSSLPTRSGRS